MGEKILELETCTGTPNYNLQLNTIKTLELQNESKILGIEKLCWYSQSYTTRLVLTSFQVLNLMFINPE